MKVLLTAATAMEIAPAIETLEKNGFKVGADKIEVLITGLGQVATTWMLANTLQTLKPDLVIQAGIAGAFSRQLALGTVVYVQKDVFGDLGMEANGQFTTIFENDFANADELPFSNGWLVNKHLPANPALQPVSAVTVNKVTDSVPQQQQLINKFNPGIETMEGAAFHYVCIKTQLPFIQLRAISNYVGERDKSKWQMEEAVNNLNQALLLLLGVNKNSNE